MPKQTIAHDSTPIAKLIEHIAPYRTMRDNGCTPEDVDTILKFLDISIKNLQELKKIPGLNKDAKKYLRAVVKEHQNASSSYQSLRQPRNENGKPPGSHKRARDQSFKPIRSVSKVDLEGNSEGIALTKPKRQKLQE